MRIRTIRALALAVLAAASSVPLRAQDPATSPISADDAMRVANAAETQLRSPVTPGHTLDMCPSAEASALRDTVLWQAKQGMTSDQIVEDVIGRRGEEMRIVPRHSGTGLLAWIAPPFVLLVGAGALTAKMRRMRRGASADLPETAAPITADDRALLDRALRQMEREEAAS
ncbi:MAG: Cytochrome c-type biosis protein [Gemmatimonadetes bacterium]|nr:Cytochrome c-type biosis protein [Gemmatimonadota bacterium]